MIADILLLIASVSMLYVSISLIKQHKKKAKEWLENRKKTEAHWQNNEE